MADETLPPDQQQAVNDYLGALGALRDKVAERFGTLYLWLFDDPEIGGILRQAAQQEWAPDLLAAKIQSSNWWQSRSDAQRKWAQLEATDKAETVRRVNEQKVKVQQLGQAFGVTLSEDDAGGIAWASLRDGMNEQQIRSIIVQRGPAGQGTKNTTDVRALARSYMLDIDEPTLDSLSRQVFSGALTPDGLRQFFTTKAMAKFPTMAEQIKAGITPEDAFADYRGLVSKLTDTPVAQVDLVKDPEWSQMLSTADPKTGTIRPMTMGEAMGYVRRTQRYATSMTGQREVAEFTSSLANLLGARKAG